MEYQPIVGLEIHIELDTKSKMFCDCLNDPNERYPNVNICPICLGHPGTLPVINQEAIKKVIKTGLALNCQIPQYAKFDRKNYFYPDLPKGYQISQYDAPLCIGGYLEVPSFDRNTEVEKSQIPNPKSQTNSKFQIPKFKKIRIKRVHLEEDTGRLIHEKDYSLVDFNRAGIPLMELVTEPDLTSAKEARKFAEELQLILRYLGVSDADMEKGQFRVEVNISLSPEKKPAPYRPAPYARVNLTDQKVKSLGGGTGAGLGTKVEIKNLNSFRAAERALEYEIQRQTKILKASKKVIQETRGWNEVEGITVSQREKEEAHDYRYFSEPDLPRLYFSEEEIQVLRAEISESPQQKRERLKREYQLDEKSIEVFVQNKDLGEYFEKVVSELSPRLGEEKLFKLIKLATNYLITDLQGLLKGASVTRALAKGGDTAAASSTTGEDFLITPENFAEFITLIYEGKISSKIAKIILEEMFKTGADPSHIIEEKGLVQITDVTEIEKIIKEVLSKNKKAIEDFKKGKVTALQFLIGQVMAQTKGKANPEIVGKILKKLLS